MASIAVLDNATQIALCAIWRITIQECNQVNLESLCDETPQDYKYLLKEVDNNTVSRMEMGILSPQPDELPMPPPAWLL